MIPPPPPSPAMEMHTHPASPDWAKDAVWYQVFPERFRNGSPASDPRPEDFGGELIPGWRVCPWGMEWYGRAQWEIPRADDFWATVFDRRFGGDLVGLRQKLPYLQDLGVNAIYLNPIFWAASLHKYDATAYHHVDPSLGPDRAGDLAALAAANETEDPSTWIWTAADRFFLDLVADVHSRGMRIVVDGVFNHSGTRCFAFRDLESNGPASKYADWYQVRTWNPDGSFDYASWDGSGSLPSFGRTNDTLNPGVKKYVFDSTRRWMDPSGQGRPSEGVDGWRLDVAYCIPHGFWREWHAFVRSINPDAYTVAEIVGPSQDWVRPDEFSASMNYEWTYPTLAFFSTNPASIGSTEFQRRIDALHARHSHGSILLMQNLLDSHDTGRVLTLLESAAPPFEDWNAYFNWPKVADNPDLKTHRPGPDAVRALMLAAAWQFAGPGAPMLYYGTEVGMWGANDPCDRQPMLWNDVSFDPETLGFRGPLPSPNPRKPDLELFAFFKKLAAIRNREPALRRGSFRWLPAPSESAIAFERRFAQNAVCCFVNKGVDPVPLPSFPDGAANLWDPSPIPQMLPPRSFLFVRIPAAD